MRVGPFIKAWREKHDLTVRDAAPLFDLSIATLSRIERGGQIDAPTQIKLIVYLFGSGNEASEAKPADSTRRSEAQ